MNKRLLAAALSVAALSASAAEFSVSPVRIYMTPRDRAVAVTVANEGDQPVVIQAELFDWSQKASGEDVLAPTDNIVLSPPIANIPPKSRQVLRLARVGPPPQGTEQTFRMVLREVPEARPADGSVKVQVALAFSIPIFVTPADAKKQVVCTARRLARDTAVAECQNDGRAYAQVRSLALLAPGGQKIVSRDMGSYLLPGVKRAFELKASTPVASGPVQLQVGFDDATTQSFESTLSD
ncbi:MAG: fimbrial biogenesis chaperone [Ramlibacter sp.]